MKSVAVIGAGITGLAAAFYLQRAGLAVTVFEAGARAGGVIRSLRRDGFLAEFGPNTILETSPKITRLIRDAGLEPRKLPTDPQAEARFLVRAGRPVVMPGSPLGFLATPLFSLKAKLAVLREPFVPPRRDGVEESIAQFVTRRLNREFLDRAVDALAAGIYAGDPQKLSLPHAFPKLKALEDQYGSLIKGQFLGARARKKSGEVAKNRAAKFSFDEGLQVLPDTLAARLGDSLRLNTAVTRLTRTGDGWRVETVSGCDPQNRPDSGAGFQPAKSGQAGSLPHFPAHGGNEFDAVIYCGTAYRLAELEISGAGFQPAAGSEKNINGRLEARPTSAFSEISYPPVASVVLGFRRADVAHPARGFGMLIPQSEGRKILGTIFSSALFPNRAPAGHVTLTSYLGGARQPALAGLTPEQLVEATLADLRDLLGARGQPVFTHTTVYPRAIPQYNVGYGQYRQLLNDLEAANPGLYFAGCYRDGVSLGDSIVSGVNIAERAGILLTQTL